MCTTDSVSPNVTTSRHCRSIIKTTKGKGTSKKFRTGAVLHADAFLVTSRNEERPRRFDGKGFKRELVMR